MEQNHSFTHRLLLGAVAVGVIAAMLAIVYRESTSMGDHSAAPEQMHVSPDGMSVMLSDGSDIPLPFQAQPTSEFAGALTQIGRNVYKVTFPSGTDSENFVEDTIYLVSVPADPAVNSVSLDEAFGVVMASSASSASPETSVSGVDFFGYKYTSATADLERSRRDSAEGLAVRFPGQFFASAKAFANDGLHGNALQSFATNNSIAWNATDAAGVHLAANTLYVLVVNEPQATFTVRTPVVSQEPTGNLYVTEGTPVSSHQLLAGTLSEPVLNLKFRADEISDIDVRKIRFFVENNTQSVDRLELSNPGSPTPFAIATVAECASDFTSIPAGWEGYCAAINDQSLSVTAASEREVAVRIRLRTDAQGASSATEPLFVRLAQEYGGSHPIVAVSMNNAMELHPSEGDEAAEGEVILRHSLSPGDSADLLVRSVGHDVVLSKIVAITHVNPDADGSAVPIGTQYIGRFRFTAAANTNAGNGLNDVVIRQIAFFVQHVNVDIDPNAYRLYDLANAAVLAPCVTEATGTPGSSLVRCSTAGTTVGVVDAGTNVTFALQAQIVNPSVDQFAASVLQAVFANFSDPADPTEAIVWSDTDAASDVQHHRFELDDGTTSVGSTRYATEPNLCGNGVIDDAEECDDGNSVDDDDCDNACHLTTPLPF